MKWKNARNLDNDGLQLILTTEKGYGINPALQVIVDVDLAEELMRTIDDVSDKLAKIELLRKFHALFHGSSWGMHLRGIPLSEKIDFIIKVY